MMFDLVKCGCTSPGLELSFAGLSLVSVSIDRPVDGLLFCLSNVGDSQEGNHEYLLLDPLSQDGEPSEYGPGGIDCHANTSWTPCAVAPLQQSRC